jgi:hypothetical protein
LPYQSPDRATAISLAQQAIDDFHDATKTATGLIDQATGSIGGKPPSPPRGLWGDVEHWGEDIYHDTIGALDDAVQATWGFLKNPDNLKIADDLLGNLAGVALIAAGAGGEIGGGLLDATGAGVVVGIPVNLLSAAAIAGGAAAVADSADNLAHNLNHYNSDTGDGSGGRTNPWKLNQGGGQKTMQGGPSNTTFFQDPANPDYYWTRDTAGHGGVAFKVYEKTGTGLQFVEDADANGDFIEGKHKGPVGEFIPKDQLKGF